MIEGVLGLGRKERAKRHIIGPGLGGVHRQMPAVMAGDADDGLFTDDPPRLGDRHVGLAQMNAVATQFSREVRSVVQEQGDAIRPADRAHCTNHRADDLIRRILQANLQGRDIAALHRAGQLRGEGGGIADDVRGDQIETAGWVGHGGLMPGFAAGG